MSRHAISTIVLSVMISITGSVSFAQESAINLNYENLNLRADIRQAEQSIIRLFNANNSTNRFNVRCQNIKLTGSHIPSRVCAPAFMRQSYDKYAGFLSSDFNILTDQITWTADMGDEMRDFWMEFTDLVFSNNEFAFAVVYFGNLLEQRQESLATLSSL